MANNPLERILIFEPNYKSVIWGGSRIHQLKGLQCDTMPIGESWEISAVDGHESIVAEGRHKGSSLNELVNTYGEELLGCDVVKRYGNKFPLLIKLIDAHDILSLQVHPDDNLAQELHNASGKSEMWYVIDAKDDARIYCGLSQAMTAAKLNDYIGHKSVMEVVNSYKSQPGQFYFIPAGTIHSIGAGNLIAEIQESSDITYRVYDHGRNGSDGHPRQLHLDQARRAIDLTYPRNIDPTARKFEQTTLNAVNSEHFTVDYLNVSDGPIALNCDHGSFTVILVTKGAITIKADDARKTLTAGHTALIPACVEHLTIEGCGIALASHI